MRAWLAFLIAAALVAAKCDAQLLLPIDRAQFEDFCSWLNLDEDQRILAGAFLEDHLQRYEREMQPRVLKYYSDLEQTKRDLRSLGEAGWEAAEAAFAPFAQRWDALLAEILTLDEFLYTNLAALLRPEQLHLLPRVKHGRLRQLLFMPNAEMPEGNVDLIAIIDGLEISSEQEEAIDAVLLAFEPQLTELLRECHRARRKVNRLGNKKIGLNLRIERDPQNEALHELHRELTREGERAIGPSSRRLVELNRAALQEVLALLPSDNADLLHRRYLEAAYPTIYPDPTRADDIYEAALATSALEPEQREAIEGLHMEYQRVHLLQSELMQETRFLRAWVGRDGKVEGPDVGLLEDQLIEQGLQREANNRRQYDLVRAIIPAELAASLPEWRYDDSDRRPPRPWDHAYEQRRRADEVMRPRAPLRGDR